MLKGSSWHVGDGKSIPVWDVAWLPGDKPYIVQSPRVNDVITVADLIDEQNGKWKENVVHLTFNEQETRRILSIMLAKYGLADRLR